MRGASTIARTFHLSPLLIGLTVVGFGTSAPELIVSVQAALAGQPGLAIGNVLGSNIFNIFGILGVTALISPIRADPRFATLDMPVVAASAIGLTVIAFAFGGLPRKAGLGLLASYAVYLIFMA